MTELYLNRAFTVRTGLVADPGARHLRAMKQAVWLYLFLLAAVGAGGERLVNPTDVAVAMGLSEATVRTWLGQLRKAGYLVLAREGRYVWVKITGWKRGLDSETAPQSAQPAKASISEPTPAKALALRLGEPQEESLVQSLVTEFGQVAIEALLEKVLAVPAERIRKSRAALLAYLLKNRH